jgi:lipid-A-disaccharide synthase-like uncharacterized protein
LGAMFAFPFLHPPLVPVIFSNYYIVIFGHHPLLVYPVTNTILSSLMIIRIICGLFPYVSSLTLSPHCRIFSLTF